MYEDRYNFEYEERRHKWRCKTCGKRYRNLGVHMQRHYKSHQNTMTEQQDTPEKNQLLFPTNRSSGTPLQMDEFAAIKELLFRGEQLNDIIKITGRSFYTIKAIQAAETYQAYKDKQRAKLKIDERPHPFPLKNPVGKPSTNGKTLPSHYVELKAMREQLDTVLIHFISTEIERHHKDLVKENERLKGEVKRLEDEIEEMTQPDFTKTLQATLEEAKT